MNILVTGATGFLGYHVVKLLNIRKERPRVLLPADIDPNLPALKALKKLDIEVVEGNTHDMASLQAACAGIDTALHLEFAIALGGGEQAERTLYEKNVVGMRNLLDAAARAGVANVVVSSSVLTVGLNHNPLPLDEGADWDRYAISLPYALSRRQAEQEALARFPEGMPKVVVVNPAFTLGPEDWVGAPANKLIMKMAKPGFRITAPIGFGILDVRDYADGVLRAAERGTSGQRYILSGENMMPDPLVRKVAETAGIKPPAWLFSLRAWMIRPIISALALWSRLRGKPVKVAPSLLDLWGRYAWYDTSHAHDELGWKPRPLQESLRDTIQWMNENRPA
ncbi:NAD-dependent epimerase/dehydratase family protein [Methylobacter sp. sgz302048]|uniref:NAD-dependent epimerase/dehydratase family protein n=1 Tax=Methylobacter sp. sgz302048 TaxID=3455945 RepID=UPI003FA0D870